MNLAPLSSLLISGHDENTVVAWRGEQAIHFDQFKRDVAVAAGQLHSCRTAILLCRDSYYFAVGFFGLLHAGAQLLLPHQNQAASIKALEGQYDLIVDDEWIASLTGVPAKLSPLDASANAIHVYTSGSTGLPQKISKSLEQLDLEIVLLEKIWGTGMGAGAVFATVSHQHIYGLTFKILWPLAAGRAFSTEMHMLWEDLAAALTPAAVLISSPAHLSRLQGMPVLQTDERLKNIFTAGAPLATADAQHAEDILGCAINEIFGSTETGAIATRQPARDEFWRPLPGIDIRTGDDEILCLRSPYAGDGWVETKDRIEEIPGGFRFLGRADTIVKIEGKRVSLTAVEASMVELPEIEKAAAILLPGSPDRLATAVELSESGKEMLAQMGAFQLNRHLRQQLLSIQDAAAVPRLWRFVDALPAQAMGKRRSADMMALFNEAS